jgi:hypothetical protein
LSGLIETMRRTAAEHARDPDAIAIYAGGAGKPGPALDSRIEALAALGVSQVILPAFAPDRLADIGSDLVARFG